MAPPPPLRPETLLPTALRKSLTYLDMSRCNLFGRLNESVFRAILGGPQPYAPSLSVLCKASMPCLPPSSHHPGGAAASQTYFCRADSKMDGAGSWKDKKYRT